jgi:hypothetical protein
MSIQETWQTSLAILTSLGGGGVLVFALSSWLSKVWAARILEQDRKRYNAEIEELKARLQVETKSELSRIETEFSIIREKLIGAHKDKIDIYRAASVPVIEYVSDLQDLIIKENSEKIRDILAKFNRQRLKASADLILVAPQDVLDAWDKLIDFLLEFGEKRLVGMFDYTHKFWEDFRVLAFDLSNKVRVDIGLAEGSVVYKGER